MDYSDPPGGARGIWWLGRKRASDGREPSEKDFQWLPHQCLPLSQAGDSASLPSAQIACRPPGRKRLLLNTDSDWGPCHLPPPPPESGPCLHSSVNNRGQHCCAEWPCGEIEAWLSTRNSQLRLAVSQSSERGARGLFFLKPSGWKLSQALSGVRL